MTGKVISAFIQEKNQGKETWYFLLEQEANRIPIYDWQCNICGKVSDHPARIDQKIIPCPFCSLPMQRLFSPPKNIICDIEPYLDDNMGHEPIHVKSRRHKKELLREKGLVMTG